MVPHFEKVAHLAVKTSALQRFGFVLVGKCPEPSFWGEPQTPGLRNEKECRGMDNENAGGRKRDIMIRFRVTEAEQDLILEKMRQYGTNNLAAYMRKIAIDGYVIAVDTSDIKAMTAEIQKIGVNINQIAKRVNSTSRIYEQDIAEIKGVLDEIWRLQRLSLLKAR
jgi:hypothetical protein